jgi:hypothetical protein
VTLSAINLTILTTFIEFTPKISIITPKSTIFGGIDTHLWQEHSFGDVYGQNTQNAQNSSKNDHSHIKSPQIGTYELQAMSTTTSVLMKYLNTRLQSTIVSLETKKNQQFGQNYQTIEGSNTTYVYPLCHELYKIIISQLLGPWLFKDNMNIIQNVLLLLINQTPPHPLAKKLTKKTSKSNFLQKTSNPFTHALTFALSNTSIYTHHLITHGLSLIEMALYHDDSMDLIGTLPLELRNICENTLNYTELVLKSSTLKYSLFKNVQDDWDLIKQREIDQNKINMFFFNQNEYHNNGNFGNFGNFSNQNNNFLNQINSFSNFSQSGSYLKFLELYAPNAYKSNIFKLSKGVLRQHHFNMMVACNINPYPIRPIFDEENFDQNLKIMS